jgi:hypothetical protein
MTTDLQELNARRLDRWGQRPETHAADEDAAIELIERAGVVTLFPASPEIPNLYHAYVGSPDARPESEWNSPAGHVYGWRWTLGRRGAGFYTAIVRSRPTWVSWTLLPALLRLRGELRAPDELYGAGELSSGAQRIARVLEESGGVLSTGELRRAAGFPTGKAQRAAYLKAVEELDTRLLLAKVFSGESEDMSHALVSIRYPEHVAAAERMGREQALELFLKTYLPQAIYALPGPLAKHLKLPEAELRAGFEQLVAANGAEAVTFIGQKGICYVLKNALNL